VIGGHLPFALSSSHPVSVGIRVLEYSIRYSIEYSSNKKLDLHSPNMVAVTEFMKYTMDRVIIHNGLFAECEVLDITDEDFVVQGQEQRLINWSSEIVVINVVPRGNNNEN